MAETLDLGNLFAKLKLDLSDLDNASREAAQFADKTQKRLDKVNRSASGLKSAGSKLSLGLTAPLIGAAGASTKLAKDFASAMLDVEKQIDFGGSSVKDFRADILRLGGESQIGAEGIAQLAAEGGKLGLAADEALEFAKVSEQIAVAFEFGKTAEAAKQAGNIVGSIRSSFGLTTKEVLEFADAINVFGENTASNAKDITNIIQRQGATVATTTGATRAEIAALAASIDAVANSPEIAATAMKNLTLSLTAGEAATKKQAAIFRDLGFTTTEVAQKMQDDFGGTIIEVLKALKGMDEAERAGASMKIFGRESLGAISPLLKNLEALEKNFAKSSNTSKFIDSVKDEFDRLSESDLGKITEAINKFVSVGIEAGAVLLPIIADIAETIGDWIIKNGALNPTLIKWGVIIGGVVAAIGPLLSVIGGLMGLLGSLIVSAGGVGAALAGIASAALPVIAAIAAIAGAGVLLYKNWDTVKKAAIAFVDSVISKFNQWKEDNSETVQSLIDNFNKLKETGIRIFNALVENTGPAIEKIIKKLDEILEPLGGVEAVWKTLKETVGGVLNFIIEKVVEAFGIVVKNFETIAEIIEGNKNIWEGLGEIVERTIKFVWETVKNGVERMKEAFKDVDWKQLGKDIIQGVINGLKASLNLLKNAAGDAANAVKDTFKGLLGIESPSKVFEDFGINIAEGLARGMSRSGPVEIEARKLAGKLNGNFLNASSPSFEQGTTGFLNKDQTKQFQDQIKAEKERHRQSIEALRQAEEEKIELIRPFHEMREQLELQHQDNLEAIKRNKRAQELTNAQDFFGELSALQQSENKKLAAIGKAAAIAEATINTYVAANKALAQGGIYGYAMAAAITAAGLVNVANIASTPVGTFNNGGRIPSGQIGIVGEGGGPELVSGPANVFSTQNTKEFFQGSGERETNVIVNIQNYNNSDVSVEQDKDGNAQVIIQAKKSIASDIQRQKGDISAALNQQFKKRQTA